MEYEIRCLTEIEEFREHARLQREIWGSDAIDVPPNLLVAGARHGAIVLGGYSGTRMVGILYGFPALSHGRLHHHSHMLGVLPQHRRRGLGLMLKLRQGEIVRQQGIDLITWTVDPLETRNNLFNFSNLGVVCNTYIVDAYGEMDDALNRGLPSDRLEVEWRLGERLDPESTPASRLRPEDAILVGGYELRPDGLPTPCRTGTAGRALVAVEAPGDYRAIKLLDGELALAWRLHLREVFSDLFERGYVVVACVGGESIARYVLHGRGSDAAQPPEP